MRKLLIYNTEKYHLVSVKCTYLGSRGLGTSLADAALPSLLTDTEAAGISLMVSSLCTDCCEDREGRTTTPWLGLGVRLLPEVTAEGLFRVGVVELGPSTMEEEEEEAAVAEEGWGLCKDGALALAVAEVPPEDEGSLPLALSMASLASLCSFSSWSKDLLRPCTALRRERAWAYTVIHTYT